MSANENIKIIIDPGHGPGNPNRGPTGYYEYQGVWKISGFLKAILEGKGFAVALTRNEGDDPALNARGRQAAGAALFISQHTNASSGAAQGVEVYYSVQAQGDKPFAAALSKAVSALMNNPDRGAKTRRSTASADVDYYTVMASARAAGCPHVLLIESGFHDNPVDEAFLKNDGNLRAIAQAQADVICAYMGAADLPKETPIMGSCAMTAPELASALLAKNPAPSVNCDVQAFAAYYIAEGAAEGVRGDVAFFQAMHETGWLKFGGQVSPEQNNFAGIGATNDGAAGATFETPEYGVRAQIQHLKAYACKEPLKLACVDPRFGLVTRGCAPYWEGLDGRWAVPGIGYGANIVRLYGDALAKALAARPADGPEEGPEDGQQEQPEQPEQPEQQVTGSLGTGRFIINGREYALNRIMFGDRNYLELRELAKAGFTVTWDAVKNAAEVKTP